MVSGDLPRSLTAPTAHTEKAQATGLGIAMKMEPEG